MRVPETPPFLHFGRGSRLIMRRWPQRGCAEADGDAEGDGGSVTGAKASPGIRPESAPRGSQSLTFWLLG